MHLFEASAPFNKCISFKMVEHPIEVGHVVVYFYVKKWTLLHMQEGSFSQYAFWNGEHSICKHVKYVLHNCTSFFLNA